MNKLILLTQREKTDEYGGKTDVLEADYPVYFSALGFFPVAVSNFSADTERYFDLDPSALVLTGGGNVPAEYYADRRGEDVRERERYRVETELLGAALRRDIPVLGICHGMQFINGYFGGKVSRLQFPDGARPVGRDHSVWINGRSLTVNSYHNDGIHREDLADGLSVLALDGEYGVVEAFRSETRKLLGIQWHPERPFADGTSRERTAKIVYDFLTEGRLQLT